MGRTRAWSGAAVSVIAAWTVGCSGPTGERGTNGASSITRVAAEPPGSNCGMGGQSVQFGLDVNRNGALDADEVQGTAYVCNGGTLDATTTVIPIPEGDFRCEHGGTALVVITSNREGTPTTHELVTCNGERGFTGPSGPQGDRPPGRRGPRGRTGLRETPVRAASSRRSAASSPVSSWEGASSPARPPR